MIESKTVIKLDKQGQLYFFGGICKAKDFKKQIGQLEMQLSENLKNGS